MPYTLGMRDDDDLIGFTSIRSGPGLATVVFVSFVTSVLAAVGTVIVLSHARIPSSAWGQGPALSTPAESSAETVALPDVTHVPLDRARAFLDVLHLRLQIRERHPDSVAPAETIIAQSLPPGTRLRRDQTVEVIVSSGSQPEMQPGARAPVSQQSSAPMTQDAQAQAQTPIGDAAAEIVEVPRLVGLRIQRARSTLEQAGLQLGSRRESYDEDRGPYVVLRQSVQPGIKVARGTAIDLVVNEGE